MTVKYNNICWENVIAGSLIFVNKSFDYQNKNQIYSQLVLYCCKESWSHCDEGEESPAPGVWPWQVGGGVVVGSVQSSS